MAWARERFEGITAIMSCALKCALKASASKALSAIRISAGRPLTSASVWVMSCAWPGVRGMRSGFPSVSTAMCSLVLSPPRERPMA